MPRTLALALGDELGSGRIPRIRDFRELSLSPEAYDDDKIFGLLDRFASAYGDGLVLYGGLTATERIYGLKRIRAITTDLDFVCAPGGLKAVLAAEPVAYHEGYDILFSVTDNVPLSFAFGHIHDWPVDDAFFSAALRAKPGVAWLSCCSREHAIMLKLRRTLERMERGDEGFGKDALDILNIMARGAAGGRFGLLDLAALGALVRRDVSAEAGALARLAAFLRSYEGHLSSRERSSVEPALQAISGIAP